MQVLLGLGKLLTVAFWWVALINLLMPQVLPFNLLINAVAILLLGLHVLEILFFNASLRGRSHRWFDRLQILLTGIFHVMSIRRP
ncbi:DUF1145 domain-containing protein [Pseudomonas sp. Marseille-QA0332]